MGKIASNSDGEDYGCKYDWPVDCSVQCGASGIVFNKNLQKVLEDPLPEALADSGTYTTAFFEAFPRVPDTFLRGEGKTIEEAETNAWTKYQKYNRCLGHEFEARHYENGCGICKHCGMFGSKVLPLPNHCSVCGVPTCFTKKNNLWYCKKHLESIPEDQKDYVTKWNIKHFKDHPEKMEEPD